MREYLVKNSSLFFRHRYSFWYLFISSRFALRCDGHWVPSGNYCVIRLVRNRRWGTCLDDLGGRILRKDRIRAASWSIFSNPYCLNFSNLILCVISYFLNFSGLFLDFLDTVLKKITITDLGPRSKRHKGSDFAPLFTSDFIRWTAVTWTFLRLISLWLRFLFLWKGWAPLKTKWPFPIPGNRSAFSFWSSIYSKEPVKTSP